MNIVGAAATTAPMHYGAAARFGATPGVSPTCRKWPGLEKWFQRWRGLGLAPPPPEEKGPKCLKGPKTTYTTIANAEKQSKRSKKGPFSLYTGSPWSHPGNGIYGARRGRSLPVHPGFSGHANGVKWMTNYSELSTYHEYGNIFPMSCTVFALQEPEVRTLKQSLERSLRLAKSVDY